MKEKLKSINKYALKLANSYRAAYTTEHNVPNLVIDNDNTLIDVAKQQEKIIADMIKSAVPANKIEDIIESDNTGMTDEELFGDENFEKLRQIEL